MKIETIKARLLSPEDTKVDRGLKFLERRWDDSELLPLFIPELEMFAQSKSKYRERAWDLLVLIQGYDWFESYYKPREGFYKSLDRAIEDIEAEHIARLNIVPQKKKLALRVKRFIKYLGWDELHKGISIEGYVNYSALKLLRQPKILGEHYSTILTVLQHDGIIEINDSFSPESSITKGYRIHRTWIKPKGLEQTLSFNDYVLDTTNEILQQVDIDWDDAMLRIFRYVKNELFRDVIWVRDRSKFLDNGIFSKIHLVVNNGYQQQLKPFYRYPEDVIDWSYEKKIFLHNDKLIGTPFKYYKEFKIANVQESYTRSVLALVNKDKSLVYRDDGRRIYTIATSLPKVLVPLLRIQGEEFTEKDLANSQWRFLLYCFENPHLSYLPSIYVRLFGDDFMEEPEFIAVREAICKGEFYEYLLANISDEVLNDCFYYGPEHTPLDKRRVSKLKRNSIKSLTFLVLFSPPELNPPIKEEFTRVFPTLSWICNQVKSPEVYNEIFPTWRTENEKYFTVNDKYQGIKPEDENIYKELPRELQRVEGDVMVRVILKDLLQKDIDVLSKHDSFLIRKSHLTQAKEIIENHLGVIFGSDSYRLRINSFTVKHKSYSDR